MHLLAGKVFCRHTRLADSRRAANKKAQICVEIRSVPFVSVPGERTF